MASKPNNPKMQLPSDHVGSPLLQRFLQYVRIESTADDHSARIPSTPGQLELGRLLVQQLQTMGLHNANQDAAGVVKASLTSNVLPPEQAATVVFNAHVDTSPEASGKNVQPQVIQYQGGDVTLPNGSIISTSHTPELAGLNGKTLITTDGTTLLGGDDKAGVAIIMELAAHLMSHPDFPRPNVVFLFSCDEEIGRGVASIDVPGLQGTVAYTFDGGEHGIINHGTFSADLALIDIRGINIHPSIAKDRMVNAIRAAAHFLSQLPGDFSPERTDGEMGFLHPYELSGGVAEVQLRVLLRDFSSENLRAQEQLLRTTAAATQAAFPGCEVDIQIRSQYRNMQEGLEREPRALGIAIQAFEALGITPRLEKIRGGTDGSQFTSHGLPTPNLSSGQHNVHSPLEFACWEEMLEAREVGLQLIQLWSRERRA